MSEIHLWAGGGSLVTGLLLSAAGTAVVRRVAIARNFVDLPGGHKSHRTPVALGGGVAITFGIVAPICAGCLLLLLLSEGRQLPQWIPEDLRVHGPGMLARTVPALGIAAGALLLHALGIMDDRLHLGPGVKLLSQISIVGVVAVVFEVRLLTVLGTVPSVAVTILWMVLVINSFNFLDNMDGLCAGVAMIAASLFALSAMQVGQIFVPAFAFLIAGVMLGYLLHNFPPATIFMGDSGSLVVGYCVALLTVLTTYVDTGLQWHPYGLLMPVVLLAVPLYDTGSVVFIRLRQGQSPFRGDQRHFSHRLVRRGMTPRTAVLTIYLATLSTGLGALLLPQASPLVAGLVLGQCLCIVLIIAILEQSPRP